MKPKTSFIWNYFIKIDDNFAKCNTCGKNYSRKGRTTTSLKGHLRSMHKEKYKEFCKIEEQRADLKSKRTTSVTRLQVKWKPFLEETSESQLWDTSHPKARMMDDVIAEMIALQNLPFHFVEGIGFRRVMQTALPNYPLRGRQFFIDHICDEIYMKMATRVEQILENLLKLSFTTYIWSEPSANVSLLSLTAHGITEDFTRMKIVLKCCPLNGRHASDIICENFKMMLRDWNIQDEHLHCFIRDGESNMDKGFHMENIPDVNCVVHQLQQCVRSAFVALEVKKLIAKCRKTSEHFNNSKIAQEELTKIQIEIHNQPELRMIQDCVTRWNSTFYMIKRLIKIKKSVCLYTSKHNIPQISTDDWSNLNKIVAILTPFEDITRSLSDTKTCISSVIPLIHVLKHTLQIEKDEYDTSQCFEIIIQNLIEDIDSRFSDLSSNTLYSLATYLDPRYKLKFFDEIIKEQVQSTLLLLLNLHYLNVSKAASADEEGSVTKKARVATDSLNDEPSTSCDILPLTQSVHSNLAEILNNSSDDEDETQNDFTAHDLKTWKTLINEYNNENRLELNEDPLLWWRYNIKYKEFAPIVRSYLSAPSSAVRSEQSLSEAGLVYEPLRNRLEYDKAEKLLFVKYNLPLLNFDY